MFRLYLFIVFLLFTLLSCKKYSTATNLTLIDLTTNNISPSASNDTLNTSVRLYLDTINLPPIWGLFAQVIHKDYIGIGINHTIDTLDYPYYPPERYYKIELVWKIINNGPIDSGSQFFPYTRNTTNYLFLNY